MHLYSGPLSLFSAKARIVLEEKGLTYELTQVEWSLHRRYEPHHPEVARLNPKDEVPVLIDGDVVIYDSTLIGEYLEERHPTPALFPRDRAVRARCRQQEAAADEVWFPHIWTLIEARVYPGGDPDSAAAHAACNALASYYASFDRALSGAAYYCGDFSVADIGSFIFANAAQSFGVPIPDACEHMRAWRDRVAARPVVAKITDELNAAALAALSA